MIYFRPGEQARTGQVLHLLAQGEALARDCARAQARLAPTPGMRRFLGAQSRQEAVHARLFQGAVGMLVPKGVALGPGLQQMRRLRDDIETSLARGELIPSLLALQVILEGLGETVLTDMDGGIGRRRYGFTRMRRMILRQEQAHHSFGLRRLRGLVDDGLVSRSVLRDQGEHWITLCHAMLDEAGELAGFFDHTPDEYARGLDAELDELLA